MKNESIAMATNYNIGDSVGGFTLTEERYSEDISGWVRTYLHKKSGAALCHLDRDDECKTFAISFKTVPTDSTGVFHILEHSVLCGSRKFPTKEPFTDLLRSSMNTFLNAMTYPDKTLYPVSSKNERDFYNLVDVYMDAVFHPLLLECESIFRQEGWRYERDDGGSIVYNGVVYSEMKGAYSSPDEVAERYMNTLLFKGGTYSHDSGGDPKSIVDLTYEDFKAAHERFYKPSNAYVILDGRMDLAEVFSLLDGYLSEYDDEECDISVDLGEGIDTEPLTIEYALDESESAENKTRLSLGYIVSDACDVLRNNAYNVLIDTIADTNASRLKKKILDTGLCTSVSIYPTNGLEKTTLTVEFKNVKDGAEDEVIAAFDRAVGEIIAEGISAEEITASIDQAEFRTREGDYGSYPKGIIYTFAIADYVNCGLSPFEALAFRKDYQALRDKVGTDYYISLLSELLTLPRARLIMKPSYTVAEAENEATAKRLDSEIAALCEAELASLDEKMAAFALWQMREDTPEALATIPRLSLSDLGNPPKETDTTITEIGDAVTLEHRLPTGGITYSEIYFDISDIDTEDIPLVSLYTMLWSTLNTESGTADDFNRRIKSNLGELIVVPNTAKAGEEPRLYISVRLSSLDAKREVVKELLHEALYSKILDNRAELGRKLKQLYSTATEAFASTGHVYAITRSAAKFSRLDALKEYLSGYEYIKWIGEHQDLTDEELGELAARAEKIFKRAFTQKRATIAVTSDNPSGYAASLLASLPDTGTPSGKSSIETLPPKNEGIVIPSKVSYAVLGTNLDLIGGRGRLGTYSILGSLLSYNLLWEEVRVKGGAYGTGYSARQNSGTTFFYSYRDPNPKRTLEIFRGAADAFIPMIPEGEELVDTIISTIGQGFGQVKTPAAEGNAATAQYLAKKDYSSILELWQSTVDVDREAIEAALIHLGKVAREGAATVVGPRETLASLDLDTILEI